MGTLHDEPQRPSAPVLGSDVELWAAVVVHVVHPRLVDDADDRQPVGGLGHVRWRDPVGIPGDRRADRIAVREELRRQVPVDQRLLPAILADGIKGTPGDDAHPHDLDVRGPRRDHVHERLITIA
jgi:hypothetical protein